MAHKVVVIGDVNGRFVEVFGKLKALHAKQTFAFAIVAGNLCADANATSANDDDELSQLLRGTIEVPLPTYFSVGNNGLPPLVTERLESNGGELCTNLTALGRRVSIKTIEGFRIIAMGGSFKDGEDVAMGPYEATYTEADSRLLAKDLEDADILITSDWPANIRSGSRASYSGTEPRGIQSIAELCTAVKPRYHFSASRAFYEREPFFYVGPSPRKVTRFISLASFGNPDKQKWIYAFSIEPSAPPPVQLEPGHTVSPFRITNKRKAEWEPQASNIAHKSHRFETESYPRRWEKRKRQKQLAELKPSECFFCLSNEKCETHMITSIGSDCYLTVAKGPLSTGSTFPDLGFPCHILAIPLQHAATINAIPDEEARRTTVLELQRYRTALHDMLQVRTKDENGRAKLGAVTWEVSRRRGVHVHWQFLPVAVELVQKGLVEAAFDVEAENMQYPKFVKSNSDMASAEDGDFFKIMIWSESLRKDIVLPIDGSYSFDLQFGRKVLAKLLGLEQRSDWRACVQDPEEEEADAANFKAAFKQFDFSLEEE